MKDEDLRAVTERLPEVKARLSRSPSAPTIDAMFTWADLAASRLTQLEQENAELRGALQEMLDVAEMFVPAPLDVPGFKRARAALQNRASATEGGERG